MWQVEKESAKHNNYIWKISGPGFGLFKYGTVYGRYDRWILAKAQDKTQTSHSYPQDPLALRLILGSDL